MADPFPPRNHRIRHSPAERAVVYGRRRPSRGRKIAFGIAALGVGALAVGQMVSAENDGRPSYLNPLEPSTSPRLVPSPTIIGDLFPSTTRGLDITLPPVVATEPSPTEAGRNPLGGDSAEDKLMPDVVCMILQDAQDEIQDHGVFLSTSEDASGEGRRQIWDRNWIVVRQDPAAGEPIGEREARLYVVKTDEHNDCG